MEDNRTRSTLLPRTMAKFTSKCLQNFRQSVVSKAYSTASKHDHKRFKQLHHEMVSQLKKDLDRQLESLIQEKNLLSKLDTLDALIEETPELTSHTWRPSGDPATDLHPCIKMEKIGSTMMLNKVIGNEERKLEALQVKVESCRQSIEKKLQNNFVRFSTPANGNATTTFATNADARVLLSPVLKRKKYEKSGH